MTVKPRTLILLCLLSSIGLAFGRQSHPPAGTFTFVLKYGVNAKNVLDTANDRFTKDLVGDTVTTALALTDAELEQIQNKLVEIDFWNVEKYPAYFTVPDAKCRTMPHSSISFVVTEGSVVKELTWQDMSAKRNCSSGRGSRTQAPSEPEYLPAEQLRELVRLIQQIVESKPEFQRLPPAKGAYL